MTVLAGTVHTGVYGIYAVPGIGMAWHGMAWTLREDAMSDEQILELIRATLAAGSGALISWLFQQYLDARGDNGEGLSKLAKRWIVIGLCVAVPSILYAVLSFATATTPSALQDVGYIGLAYMASQGLHSTQLSRAVPDTGPKE